MKKELLMMAMLVLVASAFIPLVSYDSEAADGDDGDARSYYFYGDHPIFRYQYVPSPGMELKWTVTDPNGVAVPFSDHKDEYYIQVDMSGVAEGPVEIVQNVHVNGNPIPIDSETVYGYPLHMTVSEYTVIFWDGSHEFDTQYIDGSTVVEVGGDHVIVPIEPVKDGYSFGGWYQDRYFTERFDPKKPITHDTWIFAKWIGTGAGCSGTIVVSDTHTVTVQASDGLEYEVVRNGSDSVSFTVSVVGGYELHGQISVTSDRGTIVYDSGVYTLRGITGNTLVTISGDASPITGPPKIVEKIPWWVYLLIIVVIVLVIVAVLLWWKYRKNNDDEPEDVAEGSAASGVVFETVDGQSGIREAGDPEDGATEGPSERKD